MQEIVAFVCDSCCEIWRSRASILKCSVCDAEICMSCANAEQGSPMCDACFFTKEEVGE